MKYLIIVSLFINLNFALAQIDSVYLSESTSPTEKSSFSRLFNKRSGLTERSLFKLSVMPGISNNTLLHPHISSYPFYVSVIQRLGYEFKIAPSLSINSDAVLRLSSHGWNMGVSTGLRWYYGMGKDILEGSSGDNLYSPYLELRLNDVAGYINMRPLGEPSFSFDRPAANFRGWVSGPHSVSILWGIQRPIGRRGFADLAIGAFQTTKPGRGEKNVSTNIFVDGRFTLGIRLGAIPKD
jgi:hypothetical protein